MLRTCFSTLACPDWNWDELLRYGTQFGYDGVEIRLIERETDLLKRPEFQPAQRARRRRELADCGFAVCGLGSSVRFDYLDADARAEQVEIGRAYLDLACDLEAGFIRVFGDVLPADGDDAQRQTVLANIAEGLQKLGEYAESLGLKVLLETHGDFSDSELTQTLLQQVASPAVGVLWDTHHPWRFCGEDLATTFERLKPWIGHTHWKDSVSTIDRGIDRQMREAADQAHGLMSGHRHADYVLFGQGEFPAAECFRLLQSIGYRGWYSLEWEKMWHPEIEDPDVALPLFPPAMRELAFANGT
jgi:sugar phosphate isomerase/epimerase